MHSPLPTKPVFTQSKVEPKRQASRQPRFTFWAGLALMVIILAVAVLHPRGVFVQAPSRTIAPPPPQVAVSAPLQRDVDGRLEFLGQFSAVDHLELRPQVGGTLTQIGFKDGDIVHKGDLLFVIDRVPTQMSRRVAKDLTGFSGVNAGPNQINHAALTVPGHFLGLAAAAWNQAKPWRFAFLVCRAGSQNGASELGGPDGPSHLEFPLCRIHLAQNNSSMCRHDRWGPPTQGLNLPEQAQSVKSQGVRGIESPDFVS
jgi:hypothetical protein